MSEQAGIVDKTKRFDKPEINWHWLKFDEFAIHQLEQMYRLRQSVFIVEQNCPYLDADGQDPQALHLLGYAGDELVATLRYFPVYPEYDNQASLGRVCTAESVRRYGLGRELMAEALAFADKNYSSQPIKIGAQAYLENFYQGFGFVTVSAIYLEDDIEHIYMRRQAKES